MRISDWISDVCSSDLGLGYQVFTNVCGGGPADLIVWNVNTDARFVIDVKSRSSSNRSLTPSATKCRTRHSSVIHYLYLQDGQVIGFWKQIGRASCRERVCK